MVEWVGRDLHVELHQVQGSGSRPTRVPQRDAIPQLAVALVLPLRDGGRVQYLDDAAARAAAVTVTIATVVIATVVIAIAIAIAMQMEQNERAAAADSSWPPAVPSKHSWQRAGGGRSVGASAAGSSSVLSWLHN